jgi:hypothetical protein
VASLASSTSCACRQALPRWRRRPHLPASRVRPCSGEKAPPSPDLFQVCAEAPGTFLVSTRSP